MNPTDTQFIYELIDPRNNLVCYVGITDDPKVRYANHLSANSDNEEKSAWIEELRECRLTPIMHIIETVMGGYALALTRETYWIQTYIAQGIKLFNKRKVSPNRAKVRDVQEIVQATEEDKDELYRGWCYNMWLITDEEAGEFNLPVAGTVLLTTHTTITDARGRILQSDLVTMQYCSKVEVIKHVMLTPKGSRVGY